MHKKSAGNGNKADNKVLVLVIGGTGKVRVESVTLGNAFPPSQLQEMLVVMGCDDNRKLMQWLYQNCIVA